MSTVKTNNVQIGQSLTASQNFTWYQPSTPDGTVRLGNGNSGSVTDLVTLTSAGNLGIGTSSPLQKLDVRGRTGLYGSSDAYQLKLSYAVGTAGFWLGSPSANALSFYNDAGTEFMRLDSSGNLGIGTTNTSNAALTVYKTSSPIIALTDAGINSSYGGAIKGYGTAGVGGFLELGSFDNAVFTKAIKVAQQATSIFFYTGVNTAGNALAMTLDSSGNLGLGVTPSGWSSSYRTMQFGPQAVLSSVITGTNATQLGLNWYADSVGTTRYLGSGSASLYNQFSGQHAWLTAPSGTAGNAISFTQAMTLDASGNLGIGTTSPVTDSVTLNSKPLFIFYIQSIYPNIAARIGHAGDSGGVIFTNFNNSTDRGFTWFNGTSIGGAVTQVMRLDNSGNLTISGSTATKASGTTWANPSDTRLKDNQQLYTKGLDDLLKIVVKTWEFNGKGGSTKGAKGLGVIADEIERVLPESVDTYSAKLNDDDDNETEIKRFDASEVIWLLVNSVKELSAQVSDLKTELNELKQRIN